jgi:hypothetical protein
VVVVVVVVVVCQWISSSAIDVATKQILTKNISSSHADGLSPSITIYFCV